MRRSASTLLAALALALALTTAPALAATAKTTLPAVEAQVMCVTCQIPLAEANSPAADQERAFIANLISRGETLAQIKHQLVLQFGAGVLAMPPARGFNILFYLLPIVAVLAALAVIAVLLPRWRRRAREQLPDGDPPQGSSAPLALSAQDAARLEADLRRYD